MVGVPGTSKGCVTCRKRKIRCDEGKPLCRNCFKARRLCEGYHRFKDNRPPQAIRPQSIIPSPDSATPVPAAAYTPLAVQPSVYENDAFGFGYLATWLDMISPTKPFENDIRMRRYLPEMMRVAATGDAVLQHALKAWSLVGIGGMKHSPTLRNEGRQLYTRSLSLLQKELHHGTLSLETSLGCRVLALYELIEPSNPGVGSWGRLIAPELCLTCSSQSETLDRVPVEMSYDQSRYMTDKCVQVYTHEHSLE